MHSAEARITGQELAVAVAAVDVLAVAELVMPLDDGGGFSTCFVGLVETDRIKSLTAQLPAAGFMR